MNARFCSPAVRLLILSLIAVSPGAFSAPATGTVQFITDVYGRNENAGDAALTVIRNGDTNTGCSVNWSVTGGSAAAINDYSPTSGTLNFAAGETFKNISLFIVDDALVESNETVNLTLSGAVNATISFPSNAVLTIFDNDVSNPPPASVVQFITDVYGRNENAGDASLTVTRSGDTSNACSVNWSVTGGSATSGADYSPASGTLNFAAFETFKNISLLIVDDALFEGDETVNLALSGAVNATIGFPSNAVLTIFNNDVSNPPPVIQFVSSVYGRFENQTAPLNLERLGDTNVSCSVQWSYTGGTAAPFSDFFGGSSTINFAAGQTIAALPISIVDDAVAEADETAGFSLQNPFNATLGSPSSATLTIYDNDVSNPPPVIRFVSDVFGRTEDMGIVYLNVERVGATNGASSVQWSITGGSATGGADYTGGPGGTLNFAAGETYTSIQLSLIDDALVESNETVNLTLSGPVNATIGSPSNAVLTIYDNDVNPPPAADVSMRKTGPAGSVTVGQQITYTLYASNAGPNISSNVIVRDAIPGGSAYVSATGGACTYYPNFQRVDCDVGNLASGGSATVFVTVQVTNAGDIVNFANAYGSTPDPNTDNNASGVTNGAVNPQADMTMTKSSSAPGQVMVGDQITYTLRAYNAGPNASSNVVVRDAIPSGTAYVSATGPGACTYYPNFQRVDCDVGDLTSGNFAYVYVTVQVTNAGSIVNFANAYGSTPDPNTDNNAHGVTNTAVVPSAELQITKTASASGLPVGSNIVFNLVLRNNGPSTVTNQIVVTEVIPSGFDYVGDNSAGSGNYFSFGLGQWVMPTGIVAGATQTVAITVRALTAGTYTNTAVINVPNGVTDPNTNNNSSSVTITVSNPPPARADLQITKTANTNSVRVGEQVVFTLVLSNAGPDNVTNQITVSEAIPPGFQYVSDNSFSTFTTYSAGVGLWTIPNGRNAGSSIALTITMLATEARVSTNTATINVPPAINDTNAANNSSSVVVTNVQPRADLQITKTVNTNSAFANQPIVFSITVSNRGPDTATNIVVQETVPAGVMITGSNVPPGTTYNTASGVWDIPGLAHAASTALTLTAVKATPGTVTNVVAITSSGSTDTNLLNNTNSVAATWLSTNRADLCISFSRITNSALQGETVSIEWAVTNIGPNDASNIVIHAPLPPGTVFLSQEGGFNWMFNPTTGVWTRNFLASNIELYFGFTVRVTNAGNIAVSASITNSQPPDLVTNNNSVATNITVSPALNINGLVKCATNGSAFPGVMITLTSSTQPARTNFTDMNGSYTFTNVAPGFYTVTPSTNGYDFLPTNQVVNVQTFTNLPPFIAAARFIMGTVVNGTNGPAVAGVTVQLTGPANGMTITDTNGAFIFTNLNAGNYTVRPLTNGFAGARFTPTNVMLSLGTLTNCTESITFVLTNRLIVLRAIEVNQAVQDWENSVPVVKSKPTLVRVFLELPDTNRTPVVVRNSILRGTGPGGALGAIVGADFMVTTNDTSGPFTRTNRERSLNFALPDNWINGQVTLSFEWTNGVVNNREPAEARGGGVASNGAVVVNFAPMPAVSVKFMRVAYTNAAGTNVLSNARIDELEKRLKAIYPVSRVNATRSDFFWPRDQGAPLGAFGAAKGQFGKLNSILGFMRLADVYIPGFGGPRDPLASKRLYYGALPANARMDGGGEADGIPGNVSSGIMPSDPWVYGRNRHAHEMAHSLGRYHSVFRVVGDDLVGDCEDSAPTNAPVFPFLAVFGPQTRATLGPLFNGPNKIIYGWDSHADIIVNPYFVFDLMGYCGQWRWTSSFTYTNIQNGLVSRFGAAAPLKLFNAGPSTVYKVVRGLIDDSTHTLEFLPFFTITPAEPLPTPAPGSFSLRLLNQFGVVLGEIPFEPESFAPDGPDNPTPMRGFMIPVVNDPDIANVEIWEGGNLVLGYQASAHAPTVQVLSPNGGEAFGSSSINISWTGSDLDGNPLTYLVQYSPDGGTSWDTLTTDWPGTSLSVDSATLVASAQGRIRVIASDGFLTSMDSSDGNFTVLNHAPAIAITSPAEGAAFSGSQQIFLTATANDIDDGTLTGTNIVWQSSLNGFLGTGESLLLDSAILSEGIHLITSTAFDNGGLTNSASVSVSVSREPLPRLEIELTNNLNVLLSWSITATNYHLQGAMTLPGSWNNVTNATEVVDEKLRVTLPASGPAKFFRLIKP